MNRILHSWPGELLSAGARCRCERNIIIELELSNLIPVAQAYFWQWVHRLGWIEAACLVPLGVMCMLYGWKVFKGVVLVFCAIGGAIGGGYLGATQGYGLAGAVGGALVVAVIAWPLMRYIIGILGGAAGAIGGLLLWRQFNLDPELIWVGGVAGFLLCGVLAFAVLRFAVMLLSSLQGAGCALAGIVAIAMRLPEIASYARKLETTGWWILPATLGACVCFGFFFQIAQSRKQTAKKAN